MTTTAMTTGEEAVKREAGGQQCILRVPLALTTSLNGSSSTVLMSPRSTPPATPQLIS